MRRTALLTVTATAATAAVARRRRGPGPAWPTPEVRPVEVTADDGVGLHVRVHGPESAEGTVVLAHGYTLSSGLWDQQVHALRTARPDLRVVTYDQRGHGRSARAPRDSATLEQLGRDLLAVLDQTAPEGPVVLVGHSMGGMTIMSLLEQVPDLVGPRVVGAGLVGTSSGGLASLTWGLPEAVAARVRTVIPLANEQARRREDAGSKPLPQSFLRPVLFGRGARRADVRRVFEVMSGCSAHTVADFFETFTTHERLHALAALREVPVVICVGTRDRLCPLPHSQAMAEALPHAELHVYDGAGHMLMLERAEAVSARLVALAAALPVAQGERATASLASSAVQA